MKFNFLAVLLFLFSARTEACILFPVSMAPNDRVIEMAADAGGVTRQTTVSAASAPREGMVVFDRVSAEMKVCDGTNWKVFSLGASPSLTQTAAFWGMSASGRSGNLAIQNDSLTPTLLNSENIASYTWKAIAIGGSHVCAIRANDDRLFCWGGNSYGQLGTGNGTSFPIPVPLNSTGGWDSTAWKSVAAGGSHTCAIRLSDSRLFCWGFNGLYGQLGTGNLTSYASPAPLDSAGGWDATAWKSVSAGTNYTCAIRASDDRLFCWGAGASGQLGNGGSANSNVPTALDGVGGWDAMAWKSVTMGSSHTCAIRLSDGRVFCWGYNASGQLGTGDSLNSLVPVSLTSTAGWDTVAWKEIDVGEAHTCGIRQSDNLLFCWGTGGSGRLGTGNTLNSKTPVGLSATGGWDSTAWKSVAVGGSHTCGVRLSDSRLFCWGWGLYGQLGMGGTPSSVTVPGSLTATSGWDMAVWNESAASGNTTCAIRVSDNRLFCWGFGGTGQIGDGDGTNTTVPTSLLDTGGWETTSWSVLKSGSGHICGIRTSDSRLFCWGLNSLNQLGNNYGASGVPGSLSPAGGWNVTAWKDLGAGDSHTCAIRTGDNRMFCWGYGYYGALGNGSTSSQSSPGGLTPTGGWDATAWSSLTASVHSTCGIRAGDGRLFCWGYNNYGQLGTGDTTNTNIPTALSSTDGWDVTAWKSISSGSYHTCAIRLSDDRLFCWGSGQYGRLGNGTSSNFSVPTPLSSTGGWDVTAWKSVSAGNSHTCAVRSSDDRLFCWGLGSTGQLGTGSTANSLVPVPLSSTGGWNATAWKSVSTGQYHTCAIRLSDDRIFCWGAGTNGKLGNGGTTQINTPTALTTADGWDQVAWKSVSLGTSHTIALKADSDDCSESIGAGVQSDELVQELLFSAGRVLTGSRAKALRGGSGVIAYSRTSEELKICKSGLWRSFTSSAGTSCSSYPAGVAMNDQVIEWRESAGTRPRFTKVSQRPAPRRGSMVYSTSSKTLQICDGTNWRILALDP